jgi:hypothetical protein
LHKKGTLLTSFHIHSFVLFHTDLQKNTIVTCILTSRNHIMSNMQDCLLQLMQLIQYWHVSLFFTVITNHFIGEEFYLSPNSEDGYEAMGFDVTQLTQDEEQSLLTVKTNMPIPMLMYGDSFQWAKYGHHILLSNLDLTSHNSLIESLCTDLDGNLSSTLNILLLPNWIIICQGYLRVCQKLETKAKCLINICRVKKARITSLMR